MENADFSHRKISYLAITASSFTRCNFQGIKLTSGSMGGGRAVTVYNDCTFDDSIIHRVSPGRARFVSCTFRNTKMRDVRFLRAELVDCVFTGKLQGVVFDADPWGEPVEGGKIAYEYRGNDFSAASFDDVAFRGGIELDDQRLPGGPDFLLIRNALASLGGAWDEVQSWPFGTFRVEAESCLEVLLKSARRKQKDLFIQKKFITRSLPQELGDKLVRIMCG